MFHTCSYLFTETPVHVFASEQLQMLVCKGNKPISIAASGEQVQDLNIHHFNC